MMSEPVDLTERAAALAEEFSAAVRAGRSLEWLEETLLAVLQDVARGERERCAVLADARAVLWDATGRKYAGPSWPAEAAMEARERRKEALVIADAIRAGVPVSPG